MADNTDNTQVLNLAATLDPKGVVDGAQKIEQAVTKAARTGGEQLEAFAEKSRGAQRAHEGAMEGIARTTGRMEAQLKRTNAALKAALEGPVGSPAYNATYFKEMGADMDRLAPKLQEQEKLWAQMNARKEQAAALSRQVSESERSLAESERKKAEASKAYEAAQKAKNEAERQRAALLYEEAKAEDYLRESIRRRAAEAFASAAGPQGSATWVREYHKQLGTYTPAIESELKKLEAGQAAYAEKLLNTGKSAKEVAWAMRGLPAQFTDIAVSLASGQNAFTVFMQQGGQIKDMFGSVGGAARAMGAYIAGLINPFTIGAAAVATLALAYKQGSEEATAFGKTLADTGTRAGMTSMQLQEMAARMGNLGTTQGEASAALVEFLKVSKLSGDSLQRVTLAALELERVGGQSVADTAKQFAELGKEPLQASLKITESTNFLTRAVYEQIRSLEEQGRTTEAAKVAQEAFAKSIEERAPQIVASLGTIERGWLAVKEGVKKAWDEVKNIGRPETLEALQAKLDEARAQKANPDSTKGGNLAPQNIDRYIAELEKMVAVEAIAQESAGQLAAARANEGKAVAALSAWEKERVTHLDNASKRGREYTQVINLATKALAAETDEIKRQQIRQDLDKAILDITDRYKDKAEKAGKETARFTDEIMKLNAEASGMVKGDGAYPRLVAAQEAFMKVLQSGRPYILAEVQQLMQSAVAADEAAAAKVKLAAIDKDIARFRSQDNAAYAAAEKRVMQLEHEAEAEWERAEAIGKTKEEVDALRSAWLDSAIAQAEAQLQGALLGDEMQEETKLIRDQIAALKDRKDAFAYAQHQDAAVASKKAADEYEKEWNRVAHDVGQTIADSLLGAVNKGKDFFKSLWSDFSRWALRAMTEVASKQIVVSLVGSVSAIGAGTASAAGSMGGIGGVGNLLSGLGGLGGILGGGLSDFAFGMANSTALIGEIIAGNSVELMMALGAAAPWAAIAAIAIPMIIKAFDKGDAMRTGTWMSSTSSTLPRGNQLFQGSSAFGGFGVVDDNHFSNSDMAKDFQAFIAGITGIDNAISKLVGKDMTKTISEALSKVTLGFEAGMEHQAVTFGDIVGQRYTTVLDTIHAGLGDLLKGFQGTGEEMAKFVIDLVTVQKTLDNLDLTAIFGEKFDVAALTPFVKSGETYTQTLTNLAQVFGVTDQAAKLTTSTFGAVGLASAEARQQLVDLAGGIQNLAGMQADYYSKYYTEEERKKLLNDSLVASFKNLNVAMPDSIKSFREMVEKIDLSTEGGRKLYTALMQLAPAFYEVNKVVDDIVRMHGDPRSPVSDRTQGKKNPDLPSFGRPGADPRDPQQFPSVQDSVNREMGKGAGQAQALAEKLAQENKTRQLAIQLLQAQGLSYAALQASRRQELLSLSAADAKIQRQIYAAEDLAKTRGIEIELMEAQGLSYAALQASRKAELASLSESDRLLKQQVYAAQDKAKTEDLLIREQELLGNSAVALAMKREKELAALSASDQAIQRRIWMLEDEARITEERNGLMTQLWQLQGNTAALRAQELAKLDPSNRALQQQIWDLQDAKAAQEAYTAAVSAAKSAYSAAAQAAASAKKSVEAIQQRGTDAYIAAQEKVASAEEALMNAQVEAARKMLDIAKTLRDFIDGQLGDPAQTFKKVLTAALGGDVKAMSELSGAAGTAIEAAKKGAGSEVEFRRQQALILAQVAQVAAIAEAAAAGVTIPNDDPVLKAQEELIKAQKELVEAERVANEIGAALTKQQSDLIEEYKKAQAEYLKAVQEQEQAKAAMYAIGVNTAATVDAIKDLTLAYETWKSDIASTITIITKSDLPEDLKAILLAGSSTLTKTVDLVMASNVSDGLKNAVLGAAGYYNVLVNASLSPGVAPGVQNAIINQTGTYAVTINAVMSSSLPEDQKTLLLSSNTTATRGITLLAQFGDVLTPEEKAALTAGNDTITKTINTVLSTGAMTDDQRVLLTTNSAAVTKTITALLNDSSLTPSQRSFLEAISGQTGTTGTVNLTGTVSWDPSNEMKSIFLAIKESTAWLGEIHGYLGFIWGGVGSWPKEIHGYIGKVYDATVGMAADIHTMTTVDASNAAEFSDMVKALWSINSMSESSNGYLGLLWGGVGGWPKEIYGYLAAIHNKLWDTIQVKFYRLENGRVLAKGGAFETSILTQPTMTNVGLAGEAGPEAIVPLVRGPGGYLSVRSVGGAANEEIRALRSDNRAQAKALVDLQARVVKLLERWDGDGMPDVRAA